MFEIKMYQRFCKRCGEIYLTKFKKSVACNNCRKDSAWNRKRKKNENNENMG